MACDFQDPPEKIVELVQKWDHGFKIVITKKIDYFTGFGLYDAEFI